ncbi:MAG: PDZ domain-containing protein [Planctomycetota bacterium]
MISTRFLPVLLLAATASAGFALADGPHVQQPPAVRYWLAHRAFAQQSCTSCHTGSSEELSRQLAARGMFSDSDFVWPITADSPQSKLGKVSLAPVGAAFRSHLPVAEEPVLLVTSNHRTGDGLQANDVLITLNGFSMGDLDAVKRMLEESQTKTVDAEVIRSGKRINTRVPGKVIKEQNAKNYVIGVQVDSPGNAMRSQLNLYENEGVMVVDVVEGSAAEKKGMRKFDILLTAGDQRLSSSDDLSAAINAGKGKPVPFRLLRGGKEVNVEIAPTLAPPKYVLPIHSICPGQSPALGESGDERFRVQVMPNPR